MFIRGPKKQKYSSAVNIVFHGNSITAGETLSSPSTDAFPALCAAAWPLVGTSVAVVNNGLSGYSWANLTGDTTVDSAWVNGKTNILIVGENTNSIFDGGTSSSTISDIQTYCSTRLGAHAWHIVLETAIPMGDLLGNLNLSQAQVNANNAASNTVNAYIKANYRALGAKNVIDWQQAGSPFAFTTYNLTTDFTNSGLFASDRVHPNSTGHVALQKIVSSWLNRLNA